MSQYQLLLERITAARQKNSGRSKPVDLLAVSKKQDIEKIRELYQCGQRYFGENYAQELEEKCLALADLPIKWSFIGQLQSNKIKLIVKYANEVQSIAKLKDAALISRYAAAFKKEPFPVFICINIGQELGKRGAQLDEALDLSKQISSSFANLDLQGIMSIPPPLAEMEHDLSANIPKPFLRLADTAKKIGRGRLSLGMSADLESAIAAGSDIVRIGTALFGPRRDS